MPPANDTRRRPDDHRDPPARGAARTASDVPGASVARVTAYAYHPRTGHHLPRPRLAIGGGVATAAGTTAVILALTGGATSAFAGRKGATGRPGTAWRARACAHLSGAGRRTPARPVRRARAVHAPGLRERQHERHLHQRPRDLCGAHLAEQPGRNRACGRDPDVARSARRPRRAAPLGLRGPDRRRRPGGHAEPERRTTVDATVGHGWYLARWPSGSALKSATMTTASGDQRRPPRPSTRRSPAGPKTCPPGPPCISVSAGGGNRMPAAARAHRLRRSRATADEWGGLRPPCLPALYGARIHQRGSLGDPRRASRLGDPRLEQQHDRGHDADRGQRHRPPEGVAERVRERHRDPLAHGRRSGSIAPLATAAWGS